MTKADAVVVLVAVAAAAVWRLVTASMGYGPFAPGTLVGAVALSAWVAADGWELARQREAERPDGTRYW